MTAGSLVTLEQLNAGKLDKKKDTQRLNTHRRCDDVVVPIAVLEHAEACHGVDHVLRDDRGCLRDVHDRQLAALPRGNGDTPREKKKDSAQRKARKKKHTHKGQTPDR